jgi:hypothetical protein
MQDLFGQELSTTDEDALIYPTKHIPQTSLAHLAEALRQDLLSRQDFGSRHPAASGQSPVRCEKSPSFDEVRILRPREIPRACDKHLCPSSDGL